MICLRSLSLLECIILEVYEAMLKVSQVAKRCLKKLTKLMAIHEIILKVLHIVNKMSGDGFDYTGRGSNPDQT